MTDTSSSRGRNGLRTRSRDEAATKTFYKRTVRTAEIFLFLQLHVRSDVAQTNARVDRGRRRG